MSTSRIEWTHIWQLYHLVHVFESFQLFEKSSVIVLYISLKQIISKTRSRSVHVTLKEQSFMIGGQWSSESNSSILFMIFLWCQIDHHCNNHQNSKILLVCILHPICGYALTSPSTNLWQNNPPSDNSTSWCMSLGLSSFFKKLLWLYFMFVWRKWDWKLEKSIVLPLQLTFIKYYGVCYHLYLILNFDFHFIFASILMLKLNFLQFLYGFGSHNSDIYMWITGNSPA